MTASTLTLRQTKGARLTTVEGDNNWLYCIDSANNTFAQSGTAPLAETVAAALNRVRYVNQYTGCDSTGASSSSTAFANALSDVNIARVYAGTYKLTSQLAIPANKFLLLEPGVTLSIATTGGVEAITIANGAGLIGSGFGGGGSSIVAANGASIASMVTNADKTGSQQYCFVEGLNMTANSGSTISTAMVNIVGVFVPSMLKNVVLNANNACSLPLRIAALATYGLGPFMVDNVWVLNSNGNNAEVIDVASSGLSSVRFRNFTTEHWASGFNGLLLTGVNGLTSVQIEGFHSENANTFSAAGAAIKNDGVPDLLINGVQAGASPIGNKKIYWGTNNARNLRTRIFAVSNPNSITPAIQDDLNNISRGAFNVAEYATPDIGSYLNTEQTLTYSASISWDLSLGNRALLDVTNGTAFTLNSPTNTGSCQEIQIEVSNSSGGAMGTVTLGGNFAYTDTNGLPAGKPANGKRRVYTYRRRSSTDTWVQVSATGDM